MAETRPAIRWLTQTATPAFTIQRGRCEDGTFYLSHSCRNDRVEIGYQLDIPAGMTAADVMAAAEAADPATADYWRWGATVPFTPSSSDFVRGLATTQALIEAAHQRRAPRPADAALVDAGFVRTGDDDRGLTFWSRRVPGGVTVLERHAGSVALAFDATGSRTREPILRLTLHRLDQSDRLCRFWPSFMQNIDALVAIAVDATLRRESERTGLAP